MAAKKKAAKGAANAASAAAAIKSSPYIQRLIADPELRDNLRTAYDSGRVAYGRLNNGKAPTKALMDDKKLQKELKNASNALRDATGALRDGPKPKRKGGIGKLLVVAIVGAVVAVGASEGLRNKVLDALFGAEEEFDYTSTTTPAAPPPVTPAASTN